MGSIQIRRLVAIGAALAFGIVTVAGTGLAADGGESNEKEDEVDVRAELNRANSLAGRGSLTRSVPHYEKVVRTAPQKHPSALYNLAEVLKAKEEYGRALIFYQAYQNFSTKAGAKKKAKQGIDQLKARVWNKTLAKLSVDVEPEKRATLLIDGFPVARNQDLDEFELVSGSFEVSAEIVDHESISKTIEVDHEESKAIELKPLKKTFFGTVRIQVDETDATVKLEPEKLDAPREPNEGATETSPVESPIKLETGKWLLEVTKDGFHRWVRYIEVQRDQQKSVQVDLEKKLPEEIR